MLGIGVDMRGKPGSYARSGQSANGRRFGVINYRAKVLQVLQRVTILVRRNL